MKIKCDLCGNFARWSYLPTDGGYFCDKHVPRGCTCTDNNTPCCEYLYSEDGFEDTSSDLEIGGA